MQRLRERDEVARDEFRSLVNQLVERMLAIGSRLAPINCAGLVVHVSAVERDVLAVALHRQLLQIRRETLQVLLVGKDAGSLRAEKVAVPDGKQAHQHGQILFEWRGAEMLVHLVEAAEHRAEIIRADGQHGGKADRGIHRIAPADPIPEFEHVGGIDTELGDFGGVGGDGDEMLGDGFFIATQTA